MEGVAVLHDELATAHQSEARANFIPEFGLNLVQVQGELAVGAYHVTSNRRDYLFMGGAECHFSLLTVTEGEHDAFGFGVGIPASGLFPQFRGLQLG